MSFQIHPFPPATDGDYYAYGQQVLFWTDPGPHAYGGAHYFYIPWGVTGYNGGGIVKTTDAGSTWTEPDPLTVIDWDLDLLDGRGQPWGQSSDITRIDDALYFVWTNNQPNDSYHLPIRVAKFDFATDNWSIYYGGIPPVGDGPEAAVIYYDAFDQYPYFLRGSMPHCNANGKLAIFFNAENIPVYRAIHMVLFDPGTATWGTVRTITTPSNNAFPIACLYDPVEDRVHLFYTLLYQSGGDSYAPFYHAVIDPTTGTVDSDVLIHSTIYMTSTGGHWIRPVLGTENGERKISFLAFFNETEGGYGTRYKVKLWTYDIAGGSWSSELIPFPTQIATSDYDWAVYASSLTSMNNGVGFYNDAIQLFLCTYNETLSEGDWENPQGAQIWRATRNGASWSYCLQHSEPAGSNRKWFGPQFREDATLGPGFIAYSERYDTMTPDPHTQTVRWFSLLTCGRRRPEIDEA